MEMMSFNMDFLRSLRAVQMADSTARLSRAGPRRTRQEIDFPMKGWIIPEDISVRLPTVVLTGPFIS